MRKSLAVAFLALSALATVPAVAADLPEYPVLPDVDYGVEGSFYLRGSGAWNVLWAHEVDHPTATPPVFTIDQAGYGYSLGAGFGYETGTGLRVDFTADYLANDGLSTEVPAGSTGVFPGRHFLNLRSTLLLANAYYDFGFSGDYSVAGGAFGYVGAGAGIAFNHVQTTPPPGGPADPGDNTATFAAAGMVGVGYDFGDVVADIGYRGVYLNSIANNAAPAPYSIDNAFLHEVRGTLRYRFN